MDPPSATWSQIAAVDLVWIVAKKSRATASVRRRGPPCEAAA
jgi:hypothetical protein